MNNRLTQREREHLARIKAMPCAVCDQPGPSEAHHIRQHVQYLCIPLCPSCHRDPHNGLHGSMAMWRVMKMDQVDALAKVIEELLK